MDCLKENKMHNAIFSVLLGLLAFLILSFSVNINKTGEEQLNYKRAISLNKSALMSDIEKLLEPIDTLLRSQDCISLLTNDSTRGLDVYIHFVIAPTIVDNSANNIYVLQVDNIDIPFITPLDDGMIVTSYMFGKYRVTLYKNDL